MKNKRKLEELEPYCSKRHLNPPQPIGYVAWHNWAEEFSKKHTCLQCEECGLWHLWVKKAKSLAAPEKESAKK